MKKSPFNEGLLCISRLTNGMKNPNKGHG